MEQKPYLRLRGLPVNQRCDTVLVVKLEFDDLCRRLEGGTVVENSTEWINGPADA